MIRNVFGFRKQEFIAFFGGKCVKDCIRFDWIKHFVKTVKELTNASECFQW